MYFIIETAQQLSKLPLNDSCFIQVVPSSDRYHPALSRCSLVYYNAGDKGYILPVNHSEGFSLEVARIQSFINSHKKVYLLDKKFHSYYMDIDNAVDLNFIRMDQGVDESKFECDTLVHRDFYIKHGSIPTLNEIIPITKHYQRCECLYNKVQSLFDLENDHHILDRASLAYGWVEKQGIAIDEQKFEERYGLTTKRNFIKSGLVYSYYNMYNTTGRPTNSFNSVNFVAVPKTREFRDCFIPRNNFLVEADQDAYHLRLIAKEVGYEFQNKDQSIHNELGKLYFNKEQLTEEEYYMSKETTFRQLYGGIEDRYKNIPLFLKTGNFIEDIWKRYKKNGSITLPTGILLRRNSEMNKLKLFNYWVQNLETKTNVGKIEDIKVYMNKIKCKSKLILITYDAFLFDYSIEDGKEFLIDIKSILEKGNFKIKIKYGKSYYFK